MAIVVVAEMGKFMAKRIDNEDNLKRYQAHLAQLHSEGGLVPTDLPPKTHLIDHLAAEGHKLLAKEGATQTTSSVAVKKDETQRLSNALASSSKNPYVRARFEVLMKYPEWRRKEIAMMEKTNNINNKFYKEFVQAVIILGDKLSK